MIARGDIISRYIASRTYPEVVGPFADLYISYQAVVWDNWFAILQPTDALAYMKTTKKHRDGRMTFWDI